MNKAVALKIIMSLFLYSPLIVSIILILMCVKSFFTGNEFDLDGLKAGFVGILSTIITSLIIKILPKSNIIDTIGLWIVKVLLVILILFAIGDTYERKTNGIVAIVAFSIIIIIFTLIAKIAV